MVVAATLVVGASVAAPASAAPSWPAPAPFPGTGTTGTGTTGTGTTGTGTTGTGTGDGIDALQGLPPGSEYVALGDSYAAGYGLGSPTHLPVDACGQSGEDYPHRVAARFGLALHDVTCAGATTRDVLDRHQYRGAPPQVQALSASTRLVTITIGGNDSDLFGTASSCLALSADGPVFSGRDAPSCRSTLVRDGVDALATKIDTRVASGVRTTLSTVRELAPNALVVLVGYPAIFPDALATPRRGCFRPAVDLGTLAGSFPENAFPFTTTDTRYLSRVQARLNSVGAAAAASAGVRFVDVFDTTQERSACAARGALVSGVTLDSTSGLRRIDLEPGALHPNRAGAAYLARRTAAVVRAAFG